MKNPKKPKTHVIRPIDIKTGMFIFVSKWYEEHAKKDDAPERDMWGKDLSKAKRPVGDPLKVLAVAPPFITVQILQYGRRMTDVEKIEQDGGRKCLQYVAKDGGFWREITDRK